MTLTIYHNPRCSKSRQTLELIEAAGQTPDVVLYLSDPLTEDKLSELFERLGFDNVRQMMRTGEAIYKELGLKAISDQGALMRAMTENPKLIERPIVDNGKKAVLGRPPENVEALL